MLGQDFFDDAHSSYSCIQCHGGTEGVEDKQAAHEGMVQDPTSSEVCATCHSEITTAHADSLHQDLQGYRTALAARSDDEHWPQLMEAFDNHCENCHASCGQCHVSRPTSTGSGLLKGHTFKKIPPMNTTCTGCHGSRIENEFKGKNEGLPPDVHYNPGGMPCFTCHDSDEMHGMTGDMEHRYDGPASPSCADEDCHQDTIADGSIAQHSIHEDKVSCQVCHSVAYKNCYNCHVQQSEEGVAFFRTDESQMLFKIGLNPIKSDERPWAYVLLRHVPIARDSFSYYGEDLLPNFDARPTWVYATPHNIQRVTPQNESCETCHDNAALFLTEDDVAPDELDANQDVIVRELPSMVP